MENKDIGKGLLDHAKSEGLTVRGALQDLFPFIYEVSDRMSTRKISECLKDKYEIEISHNSIAKALRDSETYIKKTASKYFGDASAIGMYIPEKFDFGGIDVLASGALFNILRIEEPFSDSVGIIKKTLERLDKTWWELPSKYREACIHEMRKMQRQGRKDNEQ
jgi:hypothetical protein